MIDGSYLLLASHFLDNTGVGLYQFFHQLTTKGGLSHISPATIISMLYLNVIINQGSLFPCLYIDLIVSGFFRVKSTFFLFLFVILG